MILCDYGCEQEAKHQLKNGNWCCCNFWTQCPTNRKRNSDSNKGKIVTFSEETKIRMSIARRKLNLFGENNPFFGKKHSIETIEKLRKNTSARRPEVRKKMSDTRKKLFTNPEFIKKFQETQHAINSPNNLEKEILKILQDLFPSKFKFVGDFSLWIGNKNPDFINNEDKKIIEFFGKHWHENSHEIQRINHFEKYGYKTLVIWDYELKKLDNIKTRIMEFMKEI